MKIFLTFLLFAFSSFSYAAGTSDTKRDSKHKIHEIEDRSCTNISEKNCYAKNTKSSEFKELTKDKTSNRSRLNH